MLFERQLNQSSPAIESVITEQDGFIRVELTGNRDLDGALEGALALWSRVADECRARGINLILAVSQLTGRLPPLKAYRVAAHPENYGWDRKFRIAFVDLNEGSLPDNEFGELVARNRGWSVRVFGNEPDAIAWLRGSSAQ